MKLKFRIPLFILLMVASVGIGTMGVHASTDCQNLFLAYKHQLAKRLHHRVSAATLARWAAWNKAHPNYRPTKKEALDKIDFVCGIPSDASGIDADLPPVSLPPLLTSMTNTFTAPSMPGITVASLVPPDSPMVMTPGDPIYPPVSSSTPLGSYSPPMSATPEPSSLVFLTTGGGAMFGLVLCRRRPRMALRSGAERS
ncbi:MAG: PEP-CTERM sorting domain-containing protein [Acidobacteriaceae bacterium]